ncbi:TetR/AcrR family transcriptional regulator [Nocardia flavorosea]|uniref:TetR/AcrR family transcriptional regulator n=1 Tax=Nocardia flavorosea TaxID=53429 RepID=A0A846YCJ2_9NOCA|nr:TetR family transcriptional regulator [Nocardia flavorosea]NKY55480.1 TetR/AcrR family transcriptional regulator [Nocardia flavorosea]
MRSSDDLTTRARIRDAALALFGEQGFGIGVRAIAKAAGISPGLVNHHFGSKDGLRRECDDYVRGVVRDAKMNFMNQPSAGNMLQQLAEIEEFAPFMAYMMRSFQAGGDLAGALFEHMVADVEQYLEAGIASGVVRKPQDLKAMARYLATVNGGGLLLFLQTHTPPDGAIDYRRALRDYADQMMLPALEIYTEGLLTDPSMVDALRAAGAESAAEPATGSAEDAVRAPLGNPGGAADDSAAAPGEKPADTLRD